MARPFPQSPGLRRPRTFTGNGPRHKHGLSRQSVQSSFAIRRQLTVRLICLSMCSLLCSANIMNNLKRLLPLKNDKPPSCNLPQFSCNPMRIHNRNNLIHKGNTFHQDCKCFYYKNPVGARPLYNKKVHSDEWTFLRCGRDSNPRPPA